MRHTRDFGVGISDDAYWTFEDARFGPFLNLQTCISLVLGCRFRQCLGWRFSPIYLFFLSRVYPRLEMRYTRDFGVAISNYAY